MSVYDQAVGAIAEWLYLGAGVLLVLELVWFVRRRQLNRPRILEMLASYSPFVPTVIVDALTLGALVALYAAAYHIAPWQLPVNAWTALAALILVDFAYYWEHRCSHRARVLWALYHSVHHSSPEFNLSTAFRVSFVDQFFAPLFYLPLVLAGLHPGLVLSGIAFNLAYQTWVHTELIGKLGWFEKIFNTPSNHRVHHGVNAKYLDRNFGAVLMVWDRLFGTYQSEEERPVYGLTHPLNSVNPLNVHFHGIIALVRDLRRARSIGEICGRLLKHPGWTPPG